MRGGYSNRLKDLPADSFALTFDRKELAVFFYDDLLNRLQIFFDISPFKTVARFIKMLINFGESPVKFLYCYLFLILLSF